MITSKQRAFLRGLANKEEAIFQLGKNEIDHEIVDAVSSALKARELIKIRLLENCSYEPREAAEILSERTKSDVVQIIGRCVVLFKRNPQNPKVPLKAGEVLTKEKKIDKPQVRAAKEKNDKIREKKRQREAQIKESQRAERKEYKYTSTRRGR